EAKNGKNDASDHGISRDSSRFITSVCVSRGCPSTCMRVESAESWRSMYVPSATWLPSLGYWRTTTAFSESSGVWQPVHSSTTPGLRDSAFRVLTALSQVAPIREGTYVRALDSRPRTKVMCSPFRILSPPEMG